MRETKTVDPGMKRFSESVDVLCKVVRDCCEEGYWVVPCNCMFLKGGFEEEKKKEVLKKKIKSAQK